MKHLLHIFMALAIFAVFSCGRQRTAPNADSDSSDSTFDFSQFYRVHESEESIYDAHRNVPLGKMVALHDLDSIFGKPILCDTVRQTSNDWSLYEQENQAAEFLPAETGDTLIMMRRVYGKEGDWLIWIDLEIQNSDSLRVLNFLAYDNSQVEI